MSAENTLKSLTTRALVCELFRRGGLNEISGTVNLGHEELRWELTRLPGDLFGEERYIACVQGLDDDAHCRTLDEALDALEALVAEAAA